MARFLQQLLQAEEPMFSNGLVKLEKSAGSGGIDTRLIADMIHKAHTVMRCLGLDTRDTTGRELYHALSHAVKKAEGRALLLDTDYVLILIDEQIISFNLIDVVEGMHHHLPYGRQMISHGQRALRGELVERYISHIRTDDFTVREVASTIGLLPDKDLCYNYSRYSKRQKEEIEKENNK